MGINSIVNACSHLQNASRARLGMTSIPLNKFNLNLALALHRTGFISHVTRGGRSPPPADQLTSYEHEPVTSANVADQRLWLALKYWENKPVMRNLTPVSKPSRRITLKKTDMDRIARGRPSADGYVQGLNLGESMFVSTDRGCLELREAIERKVGGMVLCRVS
jgi:small subunit ribosomal protein S8